MNKKKALKQVQLKKSTDEQLVLICKQREANDENYSKKNAVADAVALLFKKEIK